MNQPKSYLKWLLIVLGVVIVGSGFYYYFGIYKGVKSVTSVTSPTPTKSVTISPSATKTSTPASGTTTSGGQASPQTPTKTFEGKTNRSSESCIATVKFSYPETINLAAPEQTPHMVGPIHDNNYTLVVSSVFQQTVNEQTIASAICTTYNSLQDFANQNNLTVTKTFTTSNGYSAIRYTRNSNDTSIYAYGRSSITAIQNNANKNIVTVAIDEGNLSTARDIIVDSLQFK